MRYSLSYLWDKLVEAYKSGGARSAASLSCSYLAQKLLYYPYIPPFSFKYKDTEFEFGYRNTYLHLSPPSDRGVGVLPGPTDVVIEAGVHRGKDTAMYAKLAEKVIGFEPSPRNYETAKRRLRRFNNIKLMNEGLWNEESELEIQYGERSGNDGFLTPDDGNVGSGGAVPVNTIEHYVSELNVENVNFLKVEAEGAEPEIIEGLGDLRPEKIVVNGAAERDGQPSAPEVIELLKPMGYNLEGVTSGRYLFFTLDPGSNDAVISAFCSER